MRQTLRAAVAQVLLGEGLQDRKFGAIRASRAQALAFFRGHRELFRRAPSVKLADIVVRNQASAAIVLGRLKQGQPFAAAARQFSQDRRVGGQRRRDGMGARRVAAQAARGGGSQARRG